jgi:hypothetical protein
LYNIIVYLQSESPEREIYRDPDVVRADDRVDDEQVVMRSQTASKMLTIFRQLEEQKEVIPDGTLILIILL